MPALLPTISGPKITDIVSVPGFSVIIPVYGQWDLLARLLVALQAQSLKTSQYDVIIVNNGPAADVPTLDLPPHMHLLHCADPGSYAARNCGAAQAQRDWLVFTDADCLPGPEWLTGLAAGARAHPDSLLAGPVRMFATDPPNKFEVYDLLRGIPQDRYVRHGYAATANLAVPCHIFTALGGFDAARLSGGDAAFCRRAGQAGHPVQLIPDAWVGHPCRRDWAALATKARRVKGGQLRGGSVRNRRLWLIRSLTPPLRQITRLIRTAAPLGQRMTAIRIALRLWGVELHEIFRLWRGAVAERR